MRDAVLASHFNDWGNWLSRQFKTCVNTHTQKQRSCKQRNTAILLTNNVFDWLNQCDKSPLFTMPLDRNSLCDQATIVASFKWISCLLFSTLSFCMHILFHSFDCEWKMYSDCHIQMNIYAFNIFFCVYVMQSPRCHFCATLFMLAIKSWITMLYLNKPIPSFLLLLFFFLISNNCSVQAINNLLCWTLLNFLKKGVQLPYILIGNISRAV